MGHPSTQAALPPVDRLIEGLRGDAAMAARSIAVARAPGRLDVMGGIADYTGSRVCQWPLLDAAAAGAAPREDDRIVVASAGFPGPVEVAVSDLDSDDPARVRAAVSDEVGWARYIIGCAWWLLHHADEWAADGQGRAGEGLRGLRRGWTVRLVSDVPAGAGVSSSAAIEVATMHALCRLEGLEPSPMALAAACQYVENHIVGAPCGVMDQATAAAGMSGRLLELLCQGDHDGAPARILGQVDVPNGYRFIGIDSGVTHEVSGDPYTDTRTAAFMGHRILSTMQTPDRTDGYLANIDRAAYESQLRDRLPVTMDGRSFIERYGETADAVTRIRPERTYHVRDATDHHVREMARVSRFSELLTESAQDPAAAEEAMRKAGSLMLESHDSYGRCARLGHPLTDRLVELVMQRGLQRGFAGARITGGGCGGTVAVLLRDQAQVMDEVKRIQHQYEHETGRTTRLFGRGGPGALAWGVRWLEGAR